LPRKTRSLLGRHQDGLIETKAIELALHRATARIDGHDLHLRVVLDAFGKVLAKDALEFLKRRVRVNNDQTPRNLALLQPAGNHHRPFIGCRRAAKRLRRDGHQQIAACEAGQFFTQSRKLGTRRVGSRIVLPRMGDGVVVIAKPGGVVVADAHRQYQPVIGKTFRFGHHQAGIPVDMTDLSLHKTVAPMLRRRPVVMRQQRPLNPPY